MIGMFLNGGLGNMMFQIAALEDMGRRSGLETWYPDVDSRLRQLMQTADHSQKASEYTGIFRNFNWHKNADKIPDGPMIRNYCPVPHKYINFRPVDNTIYSGYFQSEKYFNREHILKLFEPERYISGILEQYDFSDSCSIHVRRGDYTGKYNGIYYLPDRDYYQRAIYKINARRYYIFSDDLRWCAENFNCWEDKKMIFVEDSPQVCLFMMARCTHNIIANSSFSWWGSYLNQNPQRMIIAPHRWYETNRYDSSDIYCNNWTII